MKMQCLSYFYYFFKWSTTVISVFKGELFPNFKIQLHPAKVRRWAVFWYLVWWVQVSDRFPHWSLPTQPYIGPAPSPHHPISAAGNIIDFNSCTAQHRIWSLHTGLFSFSSVRLLCLGAVCHLLLLGPRVSQWGGGGATGPCLEEMPGFIMSGLHWFGCNVSVCAEGVRMKICHWAFINSGGSDLKLPH